MALKHSVYDTDTHFSIDSATRALTNEALQKTSLIQNDHNSERFTFELPRFVEGHDMAKCDAVQVHYINIDAQTKEQSRGLYEVDDLQTSPEDDQVVICSWLISHNATQYVGSLNFLLRFACVGEGGVLSYVWNTAVYSGISVSNGIYNGDVIFEENIDILEKWREELEQDIAEPSTLASQIVAALLQSGEVYVCFESVEQANQEGSEFKQRIESIRNMDIRLVYAPPDSGVLQVYDFLTDGVIERRVQAGELHVFGHDYMNTYGTLAGKGAGESIRQTFLEGIECIPLELISIIE
mgnify:CR=1 FL=1